MMQLQKAWAWREGQNAFEGNEAVRVFHGPGEGERELRSFAIDRFKDHYWITEWQEDEEKPSTPHKLGRTQVLVEIREFLKTKGAISAVALGRPKQGVPAVPEALLGDSDPNGFEIIEEGLRFRIRLRETRHPGLFLDHLPLRRWLRNHSAGARVLNTFAYTGSLSVACGVGGAEHVATLDLSKPTVAWARENWLLNDLAEDSSRFIFGDVFEWLPRLKREGERYDVVILDPPSFSRGNKGSFSTAKDLVRLHRLAIELLKNDGRLVTSINSANIPVNRFESDLAQAAHEAGVHFQVALRIDLPETFPTRLDRPQDRYLKGVILRRI